MIIYADTRETIGANCGLFTAWRPAYWWGAMLRKHLATAKTYQAKEHTMSTHHSAAYRAQQKADSDIDAYAFSAADHDDIEG